MITPNYTAAILGAALCVLALLLAWHTEDSTNRKRYQVIAVVGALAAACALSPLLLLI